MEEDENLARAGHRAAKWPQNWRLAAPAAAAACRRRGWKVKLIESP